MCRLRKEWERREKVDGRIVVEGRKENEIEKCARGEKSRCECPKGATRENVEVYVYCVVVGVV